MQSDGSKLLNLMFEPEETVCVSNSKFGYHSIPLDMVLGEEVVLIPPNPSHTVLQCKADDMILVALNPINGWRRDECCYKYRNFLIEMDTGTLKEQINYIKRFEIPYSAMVFSGSKSVHTLIALKDSLPNEKLYRFVAKWILNIITFADQNIQNPSRSIRIPGAYREPDKKQRLIEIGQKVDLNDLMTWLKKYEHLMPKEKEKRKASNDAGFDNLSPWAQDQLIKGFNFKQGRNKGFFALAVDFALAGYNEDQATDFILARFNEESDFKERELLTAIKSGFKYAYEKRD